MLSRVDLPQPLGPTIVRNSPGPTARLRSATAWTTRRRVTNSREIARSERMWSTLPPRGRCGRLHRMAILRDVHCHNADTLARFFRGRVESSPMDEETRAGFEDMRRGFAAINARFDRVDARFDQVDARFAGSMHGSTRPIGAPLQSTSASTRSK